MGGRGGASGGSNGLYYGNKALALEIDGQKIQDLIAPYLGKYKYIGIRTQEEPFELGYMQHQSVVWRNGEETSQRLGGVSATNIKSESVSAHSDIKKDYSKLSKYRNNGYYYGNNVAIIVGNEAKRGADYGEIVIKDPKVVRIVKRG